MRRRRSTTAPGADAPGQRADITAAVAAAQRRQRARCLLHQGARCDKAVGMAAAAISAWVRGDGEGEAGTDLRAVIGRRQ